MRFVTQPPRYPLPRSGFVLRALCQTPCRLRRAPLSPAHRRQVHAPAQTRTCKTTAAASTNWVKHTIRCNLHPYYHKNTSMSISFYLFESKNKTLYLYKIAIFPLGLTHASHGARPLTCTHSSHTITKAKSAPPPHLVYIHKIWRWGGLCHRIRTDWTMYRCETCRCQRQSR
jgi:hypothetical protein